MILRHDRMDQIDPVLRIQYRLTERDLTLLGWLGDHGTLTTPQIAHALFSSTGFAQRRLLELTRAKVLARFRPYRYGAGTGPYHYVLAQLGVDVIAAQRGDEVLPRRDQAKRRRWYLTNRANLPHLLATNQFFIDLAGHARTNPGSSLERWWPSSRCQKPGAFTALDPDNFAHLYDATVAADGHGIWTQRVPSRSVRVPFFAEIDLSTEDHTRLTGKLAAYERFANITGQVWPVLFWFTSTTRERHFHARLERNPTFVPVATAASDLAEEEGKSPAEHVWWLHGQPTPEPLSLADLAATVGKFT